MNNVKEIQDTEVLQGVFHKDKSKISQGAGLVWSGQQLYYALINLTKCESVEIAW
jgi:hypothetical protein